MLTNSNTTQGQNFTPSCRNVGEKLCDQIMHINDIKEMADKCEMLRDEVAQIRYTARQKRNACYKQKHQNIFTVGQH